MMEDIDIDRIICKDALDNTTKTVRMNAETSTLVDKGILDDLKEERFARTRYAGFTEKAINMLRAVFKNQYRITSVESISSDKQRYVLRAKKQNASDADCAIKALVMPSFYSIEEQAIKKTIFEEETNLTDGLYNILHGKGIAKVIGCGNKYPAIYDSLQDELNKGMLPIVIPYFVTEYVQGGTLEDLSMSTDIKTKIKIFREIAETLSFVHTWYHLVHRDIKPTNLAINREKSSPTILDWGDAIAMGQANTNHAIGTMLFMSPNHARGMIALREGKEPPAHDYRSDLYALGLSLGDVIFKGHIANTIEVMREYFKGNTIDYCYFIASDPDIRFPASGINLLDDILHRTVSNKNDKFKSMDEFAKALVYLECKL